MWLIGAVILGVVIVGAILTISSRRYTPQDWLSLTIDGLSLGSVYALIALGYTLVYGILRMINFAHGEVFMSGPMIAYFLAVALNNSGFLNASPATSVASLVLIFLLAMLTSTVIAVLLERIAYRPLRRAPRLVPLITAIGASFFLQYTFRGLFGSGIKSYPNIEILDGTMMLGPVVIQKIDALVIL
jgi:branched-chain amino acid transport system permease protein